MLRNINILLVVFLLFPRLLLSQETVEISMTNLRAGIAKADITPSILIPLGGYTSRTGPATGIRDQLHVTAIVFDDGIKQAAIVSLDLIQVNASPKPPQYLMRE